MDHDIITRMRIEEADLSRKLKAVRDLLAAYGQEVGTANVNLPAAAVTPSAGPARAHATSSREKVGIDGFGSYGRRIVATSMMAILMSTGPVKTREIVEFLESMDVAITGENKVNAVGALLSRSSDIVSHGKGGWTVADDAQARDIVSEHAFKENEAPVADAADASETAPHAQDGRPQE